jgi:hypothetical protein
VNDSAVCYYYEPRVLAAGQSFTVYILLAAGDGGFVQTRDASIGSDVTVPATTPSGPATSAGTAAPSGPTTARPGAPVSAIQMEWDMAELQELINLIDDHIISGIITEEELIALERIIEQFRNKYGIGSGALR